MSDTLVYGLIDPRTALVRYVGKSSSGMRRPKQHQQRARVIKDHSVWCANWIRSLLALGLLYEIVVLERPPAEQLSESERWWIAYGRASGWPLTNLMDGGDGGSPGWKHSAAARARMSTAQKGVVKSAQAKQAISAAQMGNQYCKGRVWTAAMRIKAGATHRAWWARRREQEQETM